MGRKIKIAIHLSSHYVTQTHHRTHGVAELAAVEVSWPVRRPDMKSHSNVTVACQGRQRLSDTDTEWRERERETL